jgi:hypothetical protein
VSHRDVFNPKAQPDAPLRHALAGLEPDAAR